MNNEKTKLINRETLSGYFKNGARPTGNQFKSLIDSMINKVDDGISKNSEDGLLLAPEYSVSKRALSFTNKIGTGHSKWGVTLEQGGDSGLGIVQSSKNADGDDDTKLFFHDNGSIGVHTNTPRTDLEVKGVLGMHSRIGTYKLGTVPADGNWHTILDLLDGSNAFEIMAHVGKGKTGRHALLHATALSTFGQFKNRISSTQAWYGWWWWNRLAIRWTGDQKKYKLQLKTRSNYGDDINIKFYITRLWSNEIMSLFDENKSK